MRCWTHVMGSLDRDCRVGALRNVRNGNAMRSGILSIIACVVDLAMTR